MSFSRGWTDLNPVRSQEPASSVSGLSEIAACPLSPIAGDFSTLPSPTSPPSSSQSLFSPVHSLPAPVYQLLYCTTVFSKVLYYKVKNGFLGTSLEVSYLKFHLLVQRVQVQSLLGAVRF